MIASQVSTGEENDLRLRVYGTQGGLVWRQKEPNHLAFKPAEAPVQVLKRGNEYLSEDARRATRLPPGHPEAFIEAFANVYATVAATVCARQEGAEPEGSREDFPSVYDGARGVHFIEKMVESGRSTEKWTHASWRSSRGRRETV